jgi:hypothetical protein
MREIRQSGSEGGAPQLNAASLPLLTGGKTSEMNPHPPALFPRIFFRILREVGNRKFGGQGVSGSVSNTRIDFVREGVYYERGI